MSGHTTSMMSAAFARAPSEASEPESRAQALDFASVYETWFDFVWRTLRRLGVSPAQIDDGVQDVFLVVHRRLGEFEGRSSLKTWLFGIALRVAKDHRRSRRRRPTEPFRDVEPAGHWPSPSDRVEDEEAVRVLYALLDELDDDRRVVFVMVELEQMSAPEIAASLGQNVNTVYARLRSARAEFDQAVRRHRAREARRP